MKSALQLKKGLNSWFFDGECKDTLQKVEKSLKKVLTKQNVCDKINKLSTKAETQGKSTGPWKLNNTTRKTRNYFENTQRFTVKTTQQMSKA